MKNKLIAITGTPGTGKTVVSKEIEKIMKANIIPINQLVKKYKIKYVMDKERNSKIIDEKHLQKYVNKELKKGLNVIEGHMSHLVKNNMTFILRCNPIELKKRLEKKKWPAKKIEENIMSEIVDVIAADCVGMKNVFHIDTTGKDNEKVAKDIIKIIEDPKSYKKKKIDWLDVYEKQILKIEKSKSSR